MTDPVTRETLLVQALPSKVVSCVEVRRITLSPDFEGGAHVHNGPVFGSIESGSVIFSVGDQTPRTLTAGDVFYEPAHDTITRWTATEHGVTFLGYFLLSDGEIPELTPARWIGGPAPSAHVSEPCSSDHPIPCPRRGYGSAALDDQGRRQHRSDSPARLSRRGSGACGRPGRVRLLGSPLRRAGRCSGENAASAARTAQGTLGSDCAALRRGRKRPACRRGSSTSRWRAISCSA